MDAHFAYVCGSYYAPTHSGVFLQTLGDKFGVFTLGADQHPAEEAVKCRYLASTNAIEDERWFFFTEDYLRYQPMQTTTFRGMSAKGIIIAFNWFEYHQYIKVMRDVFHNLQFAWCDTLPVGIMVDVSAPREAINTRVSNGIKISAGTRVLTENERKEYVRPAARVIDEFIKSHAWICPYQIVNLDNRRATFDAAMRLLATF